MSRSFAGALQSAVNRGLPLPELRYRMQEPGALALEILEAPAQALNVDGGRFTPFQGTDESPAEIQRDADRAVYDPPDHQFI